jgi:uncharacterized protein
MTTPFTPASPAPSPIRFGEPGRQLFGMLHLPTDAPPRGHSVLMCNPFGQEAIRCHRLLRVLAERLSRSGFHVLRFDYFGTGDSDGEDLQADLAAWVDDVVLAQGEVQRMSGNRRSSWFGLRLGASLAAMASARVATAPERLVLWDTVTSGRSYLAELAQAHAGEWKPLHAKPLRDPSVSPDRLTEALGFPLPQAFLEQLCGLSAESMAGLRTRRATLIESRGVDAAAAWIERLQAGRVAVDRRSIDSRIVWASDEAMDTAIVPGDALQAIVAAFTEPR